MGGPPGLAVPFVAWCWGTRVLEGLEGAGGAPGREESCELEHALHASPRASRSRRYARAAAQRERVLERLSP